MAVNDKTTMEKGSKQEFKRNRGERKAAHGSQSPRLSQGSV